MEVRKSLVAALKNAHRELCTPPERMKEENKSRWRPRVRSDIEWESLINVPEAEALRRAEIRARREMHTFRHDSRIRQEGVQETNTEELSKAEAKKVRRLQRQEDLNKKSARQKALASKRVEEHSRSDDENNGHHTEQEEANSEGEVDGEYVQPPYLSIGLIGQPK